MAPRTKPVKGSGITKMRDTLSTEDGSACTPTLANQYCRPTAVPGFGRQMFHRGVLDARTDSTFTGLADVYVSYVTSTLAYADGSSVTLRLGVLCVIRIRAGS